MDWDIRLFVYRLFASRGFPPAVEEIARHFHLAVPGAKRALHRLHRSHALFLRPGSDDILMANPLSAVATDYQVTVGKRRLYANCAWDALAIPLLLDVDGRTPTTCPQSGAPIDLSVADGRVEPADGAVVRFPVPARHFWDDIGFT